MEIDILKKKVPFLKTIGDMSCILSGWKNKFNNKPIGCK